MSDFLTNLAARTLGLADNVRPRPAHIFEPHSRDEAFNGTENPYSESGLVAGWTTSRRAGTFDQARISAANLAGSEAEPMSEDAAKSDRSVPQTPTLVPFAATDTGEVPPHAANDNRSAYRLQGAAMASSLQHTEAQFSSPADTAKRALPVPAVRVAAPNPADTGRSGPTVRVTIGRVEVRASMAGAQQPQPATTKRTGNTSLEEYLKQRNGGRR